MPGVECFVIMPISDHEAYPVGHFTRVYQYLIRPACERAGFVPLRADDVNRTDDIALDVLRRLLDSPMAICDLSSRNPNVMYELGLRHAFNKPVTLVKDTLTSRVFDIQGLRDLEYDVSLRVDTIEANVAGLAERLTNTYESTGAGKASVNSLVQLLGILPPKVPQPAPVSGETGLLLAALQDVGTRLNDLERAVSSGAQLSPSVGMGDNWQGNVNRLMAVSGFAPGDFVIHRKFGRGEVLDISPSRGALKVDFGDHWGRKTLIAAQANLVRDTRSGESSNASDGSIIGDGT